MKIIFNKVFGADSRTEAVGEWSINVAGAGSFSEARKYAGGAAASACRWRRMRIERRTAEYRYTQGL
jgi:hypothetical protein